MKPTHSNLSEAGPRSALGVFLAFLRLGLTSFGGPVAHIGYFRTEFVGRRGWLDDASFTDLVALCQFLPGPASSQVGMAIGLRRAGWAGGVAAWLGFTLPSAAILLAFAYGVTTFADIAGSGPLRGLKIVAVAVVAQAVWSMARSLCPDRLRAALAVAAALASLLSPTTWGQLGTMVLGALVGVRFVAVAPSTAVTHAGLGVSRGAGMAALALYVALLALLPLLAAASDVAALVEAFYRSGALVFGGGHVVLPLLQASVVTPGWTTDQVFLAGYGAAQAVPGPLFTFAAYLGAVARIGPGGWVGGMVALLAIFLPGALLVVGALPFWDSLRRRPRMQAAMAGVNAAVVGILLAALYDPVWVSAIHSPPDFALAVLCFGLLMLARLSPALVVALAAVSGALLR